MRLHSLKYTEYKEEEFSWNLPDLVLGTINLVVGKNATGKSRILRIVIGLSRLFDGRVLPSALETGHYIVQFSDKNNEPFITYELELYKRKVKSEKLLLKNELRLSRGAGGRGRLWFDKVNDFIDVQIPEDQLAVTSRRDSEQHSFLEYLHEWALNSHFVDFASTKPKETFSAIDKATLKQLRDNQLDDDIVSLFRLGVEKWGRDFTRQICANIRKIGFNVSEIGIQPIQGVPAAIQLLDRAYYIYVVEDGVKKKLPQYELSSGMFRAIGALIRLQSAVAGKKPHCLVIDDIGEGLDFDRSSRLINLLVSEYELDRNKYSQLVMTSNDKFVMNGVDIKYWCVVERDGGNIRTFNQLNSAEIFDDFIQYGFSNFDFFQNGFFSKTIKSSQ
ncbi:hypothetical protein OYT1_ch1403 [Ferriphaselus amnicola]|uniref:ATPase AAA-type core domain-containing protein n=1 Tax=Ferriphaselus amnicola TaxID=1188319 RepID=A0A2Z6GC33_9PROT|nr:AAA family ATPase [Ferriphaselus amnicola]BBE50960.1 hypothetical protein OYT1_ch1403 [Ferriphaselus amnicola]